MNTQQFSLANRKQLADLLGNQYDSIRSKAKRKFRNDCERLTAAITNELAEKNGAFGVVELIKATKEKLKEQEHELELLGFQLDGDDVCLYSDAGYLLRQSIDARVERQLGSVEDIDARFDSVQVALMTTTSLEDAKKLIESVTKLQ